MADCAYVRGGQVRKMVDTVSGLDHLEGEEIKAQMDGEVPTNSSGKVVDNSFTVSSGSITLPRKAAVVHAGLGYEGTIQLLKSGDGSEFGTGHGKKRRIFLSILKLNRALGLKVGLNDDNLDPIFDGDAVLPLFSGDQDKLPDTLSTKDAELIIKQEDPVPAYILAAIIRSEVEESV